MINPREPSTIFEFAKLLHQAAQQHPDPECPILTPKNAKIGLHQGNNPYTKEQNNDNFIRN